MPARDTRRPCFDVIADQGAQPTARARTVARQRQAQAAAARVAADPLSPLRERLGEIEEQIAKLGAMHRRQGDALAGRLVATLERERAEIAEKIGVAASSN